MVNFNAYGKIITHHKWFPTVLSSNKGIIYQYWWVTLISILKNTKKSDLTETWFFHRFFPKWFLYEYFIKIGLGDNI